MITDVRLHPNQDGYIFLLDGQYEYACPPGDRYYQQADAIFNGAMEPVGDGEE